MVPPSPPPCLGAFRQPEATRAPGAGSRVHRDSPASEVLGAGQDPEKAKQGRELFFIASGHRRAQGTFCSSPTAPRPAQSTQNGLLSSPAVEKSRNARSRLPILLPLLGNRNAGVGESCSCLTPEHTQQWGRPL